MTKKILIAALIAFSSAAQGKTVNLHFNPFGLLLGLVDANLDVAITERFTLGPSLVTWDFALGDLSWKFQGVGARASYYLTGPAISDSWYLSIFGRSLSLEVSDTTGSGELTTTNVGGSIGYHWVWSTFNLMLGYSFFNSSSSTIELKDASGTITGEENLPGFSGGSIEFRMGLAF